DFCSRAPPLLSRSGVVLGSLSPNATGTPYRRILQTTCHGLEAEIGRTVIPGTWLRVRQRCIGKRHPPRRLPKIAPGARAPAGPRHLLQLRVRRTVEEPLARRIEISRRDRPVRLRLAVGIEGQLDLNPAGIVD